MPERDRRKLDFYTRAFVEAMSPSNVPTLNPVVLRETMEQKGANLVRGVEALAKDVERGKGQLIISQTDMDKFEVVATWRSRRAKWSGSRMSLS